MYCLSKTKPIAHGGEKWIYMHPESSELIIKIWRQQFFEIEKKKHPLITKYRRTPKHCALINEIIEHLVLREQGSEIFHLQEITGLVDTDLGTGLVVKAIRDPAGKLAPTLEQLIQAGKYGPQHTDALKHLLTWIENTNVIVRNLSLSNILWDEGNRRFVVIDGIGCKPSGSFRRYCKRYNRYSNVKMVRKLKLRKQKAQERVSPKKTCVSSKITV